MSALFLDFQYCHIFNNAFQNICKVQFKVYRIATPGLFWDYSPKNSLRRESERTFAYNYYLFTFFKTFFTVYRRNRFCLQAAGGGRAHHPVIKSRRRHASERGARVIRANWKARWRWLCGACRTSSKKPKKA